MTDILAMAWREAAGRLKVSLGERTPYVLARLFHREGAELRWMIHTIERMDTKLAADVMRAAQMGVDRRASLPEIQARLAAVQRTHRAGLAAGRNLARTSVV
ncbi:hypothetical protein [Nocardia amamiensis]|uniref:hypothetical protein n=1 Tax=Nocardia amamiensis TaxID=404578 RepID=UPI00082AA9AF|nr:hypothetical protein [Nocardia amamiensis]